MVVSFSKLGSHGRSGNVLFQFAATLGIAERNNAIAMMPHWQYEHYFDIQKPDSVDLIHMVPDLAPKTVLKEQQYHYEPVTITGDTDLLGYYQSAKYFPSNFDIKFKRAYTDPYRAMDAFKKPTIGIHIRRGDYVNHPDYYQLPITWYISALMSIPNWQDHNIVIVSDDMAYCRVHFECLSNAFFIPGTEIQHLMLLSLCDKHILSNSSYSWWGAYLSGKNDVIRPVEFFRGKLAANDTKDYWPEEWRTHATEKIDLKDVTFTIPVFYDHPDRKKNLDLSVCDLQKSFNTNITIGEQGGSVFEYMKQYCEYTPFTTLKVFHRTKMLNDMAMAADTPYIANWDADVFIPPMQVLQSVMALRGGADVSYPYDGRFARMDRHTWWRKLEAAIDIGIVRDATLSGKNGKPVPVTSVGGALIWNKDSFIDAGMENEYMISFGPEDVERWERMNTLKMNIHRAGGCLYHMNHFVGPDSCRSNPYFAANHDYLNKQRAMNAQQLREYIDKWPWRHKYTGAYYARISEGAIRSAKATYAALGVKDDASIIDIGCGVGEWGVDRKNYTGVDHGIPKKALLIDPSRYMDFDLEQGNMDTLVKYDLCLCLEVAEHISPQRADWLVATLCKLSDTVLFSAAIPNQGGTGHINEQWQTYWAEKFKANGYGVEVEYPMANNNEVEFWYRQNMVLYIKGQNGEMTNYVLPEYYEQITNHLKAMAYGK